MLESLKRCNYFTATLIIHHHGRKLKSYESHTASTTMRNLFVADERCICACVCYFSSKSVVAQHMIASSSHPMRCESPLDVLKRKAALALSWQPTSVSIIYSALRCSRGLVRDTAALHHPLHTPPREMQQQLSKNAFDELCNLRHAGVQRCSRLHRSESHSNNLHACEINFRRSLA